MKTRLFIGAAMLAASAQARAQSATPDAVLTADSLRVVIARQQAELARISRVSFARADTIFRLKAELRSLRTPAANRSDVEVVSTGDPASVPPLDLHPVPAGDARRPVTPHFHTSP